MTQQINLFSPVFKTKPVTFGLIWLICVVALILSSAFGAWWFSTRQLNSVEDHLAVLQTSKTALGRDMEALIRAGDMSPAPRVEPEKNTPVADVRTSQATLQALKNSRHGTAFSAYFDGLALAQAEGVWLTGFVVRAGSLSLQGRANSATLLPAYLDALNQQKVFTGSEFQGMHIGGVENNGGGIRFELQNQAASLPKGNP
ncbi:PilN domain-containing protein [Chitinimonas sp. PSY-7]|uniref:PilN domain-containing protein n=1 Tax=Chitinimonas sp. PSY-7 TaxID=3459088 RepID=UPI00403FD66D